MFDVAVHSCGEPWAVCVFGQGYSVRVWGSINQAGMDEMVVINECHHAPMPAGCVQLRDNVNSRVQARALPGAKHPCIGRLFCDV